MCAANDEVSRCFLQHLWERPQVGVLSAATAAEPCRTTKVDPLPPSRVSQADPLHEITQEVIARPHAEEPPADGLFSREFPFHIQTYVFSREANRLLKDRQNCLALFVPLDGLLRVDIERRPVDLHAGEILIAHDPKTLVTQPLEEPRVQVLVISSLSHFVYSLGSPSRDYFFLSPFHANHGLRHSNSQRGSRLAWTSSDNGAFNSVLHPADRLLRGWLQGAFSRIALLYRPPISRRGVDSIRDGFPNRASGKTRAHFGVCEREPRGADHAQGGSLPSQDERPAIRQAIQESGRDELCQLPDTCSPFSCGPSLKRNFPDDCANCLRGGIFRSELFRSPIQESFRSYSARLPAKFPEPKSEWKRSTIIFGKLQCSGIRNP